ncbi:MAG: hypothetical protein J6O49_21080 [Bacteroidaceae bacterium]|nr:hypothetical protein [Bacteroidaceae bacterium]
MAYVQPNSTIEFFSDINLSDKYTDSLYFASVNAKDTYFTNLTKVARVLTCSYTRENRGYVRVEVPMSTLIGATYMRFKNTSFENKWFYAFVKNVNYINNQTTEVMFELDPLMTWMGTFTLNECYIERQHTLNDGIGNNICEEGLPLGEYVIEGQDRITLGSRKIAIIYLSPNQTGADGQWLGGTYTGCHVAFADTPQQADSILDNLVAQNLIDNVGTLMMIPSEIADATEGRGEKQVSVSKPYSGLSGYVPRNKKLFCYPYKYMRVDNSEGSEVEYLYEYFNTLPDTTSSGDCTFTVEYTFNGRAEASIAPENYKGLSATPVYNERLGMGNFPMCAWGTNSYLGYLAQKNAYLEQNEWKGLVGGAMGGFASGAGFGLHATPVGAPMGSLSASGGIIGGITGTVLGGAIGAAKPVIENMIENKVRPTSPATPKGSAVADNMWAHVEKCFRVNKMCITKNYGMMLDSYFDMFGYAIKQHGVPNMNARPNWTFVKTIGCNVGGAIPADDASVIEAIFDNGIRFWKNHNNIGNYSLNNAPST